MQDSTTISPLIENDPTLVDRAIQFATEFHSGQTRKITNAPYIWHPLAVGQRLTEFGCSPITISAGILHDVVEDTPATHAEVESNFGPEVARLVDYCSEPCGGQPWEERKNYLIERIRSAPVAARLIVAVDKNDNLKSVHHGLEALGTSMWERFSRGPAQQEWYYRSIAAAIRGLEFSEPSRGTDPLLGTEYRHSAFDELDARIVRLFGVGPSSN